MSYILVMNITKTITMVSSVDEFDPESDGWMALDKRIPTAMYSFPTITVNIEDFCATKY